ncbi:putative per-hexamer repeat protein 5 isoform X3 [Ruditapes philippinarum]|uniref:putative per-hexamer repeat protein 5 isoform X2 n=1 Tax=Ruditapes philippinarum TaxID=129788 RepID=UPI00295BCB6E|nr:putative per-hexamer repeat protein 5 isoform X2 [Ruditapes philippinarum]XP_060605057.1 putative per-hexamer repeat protein 5 isoform X3 [Ruditapes philippinarum]
MKTSIVFLLCVGLVAVSAKNSKIREKLRKRAAGCVYKGQTYQQGMAWQDGCLYNCICENGATGSYKCTDRCPSYGQLPPVCALVKKPGQCCAEPQCNFQSSGGGTVAGSGGTLTGSGTMTGTGTGTATGGTMTGTGTMTGGTGGVCVDKLTNCASYTKAVCSNHDYAQWVQNNCCAFCNGGTGGTYVSGGTGGTMTGTGGTMTGTGGTMTGTGGTMTGTGGTMTGGTYTGTCQDTIPNCAAYTAAVCTDSSFADWVSKHCAKFCNKCGAMTGGTMTGTGGTMTGTGGTMTGTGGTGTGGTMTGTGGTGVVTGTGGTGLVPGSGHMTGTGGTGGGACADKLPDCASYDHSICDQASYHDWVFENCQHWCNKCGVSGGISIPVGTGTGTGTGTGGTMTGGTGTMTGGTGTMTGGTMTGTCADKLPNCAAYTQAVCTSKDYATWVLNNCAHYCNKCGSMTGGTGTMTGGTGTMTGGTGTMTGGTGTMTGGTGGASATYCMDKKSDCNAYEKAMCTDIKFKAWAKENCAAFCNMCGGGTGTGTMTGGTGTGTMTGGTGTMTGSCGDVASNCALLNQANHICSDAAAKVYAQQNCAKTCNMCGGTMTGGTGTMTGGTGTMTGGTGTGTMTGGTGTGTMTGGTGTMTGSCSDTIANCAAYDPSICTSTDYKQWASQNCAGTCHLCSSQTSGGSMTGTVTGTGGGGVITGTGTMTGTGTGTGGTMTGSGSGCVYAGHLYTQGQSWKDGCKFRCQCVEGATGKYQCTQLCVQWQLPQQCHMNPPAPGKCCQTPSCPAGFDIKYPVGYTEE